MSGLPSVGLGWPEFPVAHRRRRNPNLSLRADPIAPIVVRRYARGGKNEPRVARSVTFDGRSSNPLLGIRTSRSRSPDVSVAEAVSARRLRFLAIALMCATM